MNGEFKRTYQKQGGAYELTNQGVCYGADSNRKVGLNRQCKVRLGDSKFYPATPLWDINVKLYEFCIINVVRVKKRLLTLMNYI